MDTEAAAAALDLLQARVGRQAAPSVVLTPTEAAILQNFSARPLPLAINILARFLGGSPRDAVVQLAVARLVCVPPSVLRQQVVGAR